MYKTFQAVQNANQALNACSNPFIRVHTEEEED